MSGFPVELEAAQKYNLVENAFLPIRVKGRNIGKPQWGQYEIWKDGVWKEYVSAE